MATTLIENGLVNGTISPVERDIDYDRAEQLIRDAIHDVFTSDT